MNPWRKSIVCMIGLLAGAILCTTGCLDAGLYMVVRPDGSGAIRLSVVASGDGLAKVGPTVRSLAQSNLLDAAKASAAFGIEDGELSLERVRAVLSDEALAGLALHFGKGVHFVRSVLIHTDQRVGFAALYRFDDLNEVRIGSPGDAGFSVAPWFYRFAYIPGEWNRIVMIPPSPSTYVGKPSLRTRFDDLLSALGNAPGTDQQIRHAFQGAQARFVLRVPGELGRTNAKYCIRGEETRIVLFGAQAKRMDTGAEVLRVLTVRSPPDLSVLYHERLEGVVLQNPMHPLAVEFRVVDAPPPAGDGRPAERAREGQGTGGGTG